METTSLTAHEALAALHHLSGTQGFLARKTNTTADPSDMRHTPMFEIRHQQNP